MSFTIFAVIIGAVLVLGWLGFLIIAGSLARDTVAALRARKSKSPAPPHGPPS